VLFAITVMGAGFAPLMIVRVMGWPITPILAFCMMFIGLSSGIGWRLMGYHAHVYDALPGMAAAFIVYIIGRGFIRLTCIKSA